MARYAERERGGLSMGQVMLLLAAVLLPIMLATAFLLGRYLRRRHDHEGTLSPVARQHLDLFQGGQLSESAVESAKAHFRALLERGQVDAVEASMRPGTQYVVHVRALTELGTDAAGLILERQLNRRLSDDVIEQSWYWIDLANGLRHLNRQQSLPQLLRCAERASEFPLGHFFAAETVCFLGFSGYLRQYDSPLGRAAMRVLHRALEGLRHGVQPILVAEARLGEMIEQLWEQEPSPGEPLAVRVFHEAVRLHRRTPSAESLLANDSADQEAFKWQATRLAGLVPWLTDYLREAPLALREGFDLAGPDRQRDLLNALLDLRAEAADLLLPLVKRPDFVHRELAIEVLSWSRDPRVSLVLRDWVSSRVEPLKRLGKPRCAEPPRRSSVPSDMPYLAVLRALRNHPSLAAEDFLGIAAHDWDPTVRAVAFSALGWWEPVRRVDVRQYFEAGQRDPNPEVRQAARGAAARVGERQALQWFRHLLHSEEAQRVHEGIQLIVTEGLSLLWPDLDQLTDSPSVDVACHAREAVVRLGEEMEYRRS